jgi:hypothetical protein
MTLRLPANGISTSPAAPVLPDPAATPATVLVFWLHILGRIWPGVLSHKDRPVHLAAAHLNQPILTERMDIDPSVTLSVKNATPSVLCCTPSTYSKGK